jgi:chemotaxis protein methyltransferase CheR
MTEQADSRRSLSLSYGDYLRFSQLAQDRFGLRFPEKRFADLEQGIRHAFAASTCSDLDQYYQLLLDSHDGGVEMDRLVNALTINETYFFRDAGQFDALYTRVLPQIIERRRPLRTMRIWSAGCSSGEEPYSIAMILRDLLPDVDDWSITILGTDVNTEALDRARKAIYSEWSFREERAKMLRPRFFRQIGKQYELVPEVRRMVTFSWLNLAEDSYPAYETNTTFIDLIMCRNVSIYFSQPVIRRMTDQFYDALVDGGWLVVGHSESSPITYRRFQAHTYPNAVVYRRSGQETELPQGWEWLPETNLSAGWQPSSLYTDLATPKDDRTAAALDSWTAEASDLSFTISPDRGPEPEPEPEAESEAVSEQSDGLCQAQFMLDYGRSEEARDLLFDELTKNPDDAPACVLMGQACANLGEWEEAEKWSRRAVALEPLSIKAYHILALVLQHQGHLDQAIKAMKKVVYIDRSHILGHFSLAGLYRSNGQLPQALKSLDNSFRLVRNCRADEVIPESGGIVASRLLATITRQQQQWGVENGAPRQDERIQS